MRIVPTLGALVTTFVFFDVLVASPCQAQAFTQRGFVETRGTWFPQDASNDTTNLVVDVLGREEVFLSLRPWLRMAAGADLRANSHNQVDTSWPANFFDRDRRRPVLAIRRLSATINRGPLTLDVGKQFMRWGKTDIVTPTDRFAPRDFLNVIDSEFLPVTGARASFQIHRETFEFVWVPALTPSRTPLVDQRWIVVPEALNDVTFTEGPTTFPDGGQGGVRWGHAENGYEFALTYFDGFNHLPTVDVRPGSASADESVEEIELDQRFPSLRMYGADGAVPNRWFTLKAEAALFTAPDADTDEYVLYVIQLERQVGEWSFVGGYAGEAVTERRVLVTFAPDRGFSRAFVGRAALTIDANRSAAIEAAVRQNADGVYIKGEYSIARGQHWRTTMAGTIIAGDRTDFIGQYNRNSHVILSVRYSF